MYVNGERMMAWVAKIDEVAPIPEADAIEAYRVGGWWVVDRKNAYRVGDRCVYVSIDSWVPTKIAPFLSKGQEPRLYNGTKGERLRTVKLRGKVSQGLLLPMNVLAGEDNADVSAYAPGDDCTEFLNIKKWEAPVPARLAGDVEGPMPSQIPKTDQERIQNLSDQLAVWYNNPDFTWEVTEKLDGSSMTVFVIDGMSGVCSRNWSLKDTEGNTFWSVARRESLIEKIRSTGRNLALQGELIGEGIQRNQYKIRGQDFRLFDIYDIDAGEYLSPVERRALANNLDIKQVPLVEVRAIAGDMVSLLGEAEGKSSLNPASEREGIVYKCNTFGGPSFKAISNRWLLKNGD